MRFIQAILTLAIVGTNDCQEFKDVFKNINTKMEDFNAVAAEVTWESLVNTGNPKLAIQTAAWQKQQIEWQHKTCEELATLEKLNLFSDDQLRQTYLLCRGPVFTYEEARLVSEIYEELKTIYSNAEVCIPAKGISPNNLTQVEIAILKSTKPREGFLKLINQASFFIVNEFVKDESDRGMCFKGEDDFQKLMVASRNENVLSWTWLAWREIVGPPMKELYRKLVEVENSAARRNGYSDIGVSWREELEIPNLRQESRQLWDSVKPLYTLLHGVVRFCLRMQYGDVVPEKGPIPANLLGSLCSQNWEPLLDLIIPNTINLDQNIAKLNWTVEHMVKRAEDFYLSLGLPPMTETFWNKSVFTRVDEKTTCHGTAADMFKSGDFRLLYCSGTTIEDFYVLHHEFGHIQYYMAYEHQPAIFRQANSAFQEAIGDAIMSGVMTPQHLHRLSLIDDALLYSTTEAKEEKKSAKIHIGKKIHHVDVILDAGKINNYTSQPEIKIKKEYIPVNVDPKNTAHGLFLTIDDILLLKQALNKIPQIPFSLLLDEYRWQYFEGGFTSSDTNKAFWQMALELQGIAPPIERGANYFDAGAKFHVPDNIPYIRYFLSNFFQHQLFESLCKAAVFGRRGVKNSLPHTITMNRCDIYGSKAAGKILLDIMSRGHSQHWQRILHETVGEGNISSGALLRYYRPLYKLLQKVVRVYNIPTGW